MGKSKRLKANELLIDGCFAGDLKIVKLAIKNKCDNFDTGLYYACEQGSLEITNLMIENWATKWNSGLVFACRGGHTDIIKLMIEKGANDWNWALTYACQGGHIEIVKMLIEGADSWNDSLRFACYYGYWDIINLMIEKGANNWNEGLHHACRDKSGENQTRIVELMIEKGANNIRAAFFTSCTEDQIEAAKFLIKYVNVEDIIANCYDDMQIILLLIENGAKYDFTPLTSIEQEYLFKKKLHKPSTEYVLSNSYLQYKMMGNLATNVMLY